MSVECPWEGCERSLSNERGMKQHHARTHGKSVAGEEYTCPICGDNFRRRKSRVFSDNPTCSEDCQAEQQNKSIDLTCDNCSTPITKRPSVVERFDNHFCGEKCYGEFRQKDNHIITQCDFCGDDISKHEYHAQISEKDFCDKECLGKWQSENWRGKNHPQWIGGTIKYYGLNWNVERQRCLEKSDYSCEDCGLTNKEHQYEYGCSLHVHHITPIRLFDVIEDANTQDNLVTLCASCHKTRHGNNRPMNLEAAQEVLMQNASGGVEPESQGNPQRGQNVEGDPPAEGTGEAS